MVVRSPESLKCLIVDDHVVMRKIIKEMLSVVGVRHTEYAENGKEAYEKLYLNVSNNTTQFDILFLDWSMPEVDGYTVLKKCRGDKQFDRLAIVMITAEAEKNNVVMAIKTGATSFIQKPFAEKEFVMKFASVLKWIEQQA